MSLPNFRQMMPASPAQHMHQPQMMNVGSPVSFNILKDRLKSNQMLSMGGRDASPFVMSQNGNSAFNPQKLGARFVANNGTPKPPKAPEKPLMPYMRYSKKVWDQVKSQNPDMKFIDIGKVVGVMWKKLTDAEKSEFVEEYEADKVEYERKMAAYKNTPAYQAYIQAKSKGAPIVEDPDPRGLRVQERRIDIQPAEDEEDPDDGLSVKHIAHARFVRNHCLINDIFSEAMVPDVRNVVTTGRMQVLKRQVQSLTMHQKKLETELQQLEEKYNAKKRQLQETSDEFGRELKKHCDQPVNDDKFKEMINEQLDKLRVEREERNRAGASTPPSAMVPPVEQFENRNVLKPVERPDEAENPENNPDGADNAKPDQNGEVAKTNGDARKPAEDEKTEYAEMTNQRTSGNFSGFPAPPGYPPAGGMMMPGPPANGFAPPGMPPPPPYMNGSAPAQANGRQQQFANEDDNSQDGISQDDEDEEMEEEDEEDEQSE